MRRIRGLAFRYYWLGRLEGTTGLRGSQFDAKEDIKIRGDHCDHKLVISPPLLPLIPKCRPQWHVQSFFSKAHFRDVTVAMQGTGAIHVTIYLAGGTLVISIVSHLPLYGVSVAQFYRANQPSTRVSRSSVPKRYVMKETLSDLPDSALYTKQNICDNTLDDAQLETRCPLDNGRHADALMSTHYPAGQLDQLPAELLIQILLQIDIPSLTHFRLVNRRAMGLVDPIPQYAALIKHCPNIIRAILSIQADAFDCGTLYRTLSTYRCSTCKRFGDYISSTAAECATSASPNGWNTSHTQLGKHRCCSPPTGCSSAKPSPPANYYNQRTPQAS